VFEVAINIAQFMDNIYIEIKNITCKKEVIIKCIKFYMINVQMVAYFLGYKKRHIKTFTTKIVPN
jgi:hypothetical protein